MSRNKIRKWLSERPEIESIFACVCDLNGTLRGKRVPVEQAEKVVDGDMRMPLSAVSVDVWGEDIKNSELVFETGNSDGLCDFTGRDLLPINSLTFAPHENSYRRLMPGAHAPTSVAWGFENRTAAIRIAGGTHKACRIEHRVAGGDANPYLVLTAILGGALAGIEREMMPAPEIVGDAYSLDLPHLPLDWASAVEAFAQGELVPEVFSERLQTMLVECKPQERKRFARHVTDFEYHSYLEVV